MNHQCGRDRWQLGRYVRRRVLGDFVDNVTIIERDAILRLTSFDPESRRPAMYINCWRAACWNSSARGRRCESSCWDQRSAYES